MVDLGSIYMMFLKDDLQYEKQKRGKNREAKKQGNRNQKKCPKRKTHNSTPKKPMYIYI